MSNQNNPTYKLRFFFDYGCGGCLWCGNEASYLRFDTGTLDAEIVDLKGTLIQEPKIKLPAATRQKVLALDLWYSESLNWNDPGGPSMWEKEQWDNFHKQARALHMEISIILGDDFEVVYEQET